MARYATDSTSSMLEPEQRRTVSAKLAYHRNLREGLLKMSESPEKFILVATQPLLSCLSGYWRSGCHGAAHSTRRQWPYGGAAPLGAWLGLCAPGGDRDRDRPQGL